MLIVAGIFAGLAALVHVYIFVLESLRWQHPRTRATFDISAELAEQTEELAFNQGFYNLFLAVITVVGLSLLGAAHNAGIALIAAATGSMSAAAVVLVSRDYGKARAGIVQGLFPLVTLVALVVFALN